MLSYAKVRALTRIAKPETDASLVEIAQASTGAQLEKICRRTHSVATAVAAAEGRPTPERCVRHRMLDNGLVRIEATLHPDEAALVLKALEAGRERLRGKGSDAGRDVEIGEGEMRAEAASPTSSGDVAVAIGTDGGLASIRSGGAQISASSGGGAASTDLGVAAASVNSDMTAACIDPGVEAAPVNSGEEAAAANAAVAAAADDSGVGGKAAARVPAGTLGASAGACDVTSRSLSSTKTGQLGSAADGAGPTLADALVLAAESFLTHQAAAATAAERYQLFIHLEQDLLGPDGMLAATLDDGTPIPAETLRRLTCDVSRTTVCCDENGQPAGIGRNARTVSGKLRRALWARDRGCRFPGCTHRLYVQAHHIQHWAHGGETSLANTVLLCSRHHALLHEGGFSIERSSTGKLLFRSPAGDLLETAAIPAPVPAEAAQALCSRHAEAGIDIDPFVNLCSWDGVLAPDYERIVEVAGGWA